MAPEPKKNDSSRLRAKLKEEFENCRSLYKSCDHINAIKAFERLATKTTSCDDPILASKTCYMLAKLHLLKRNYITALEWLNKCENGACKSRLLAKCALVAYKSKQDTGSMQLAIRLLKELLEKQQVKNDPKECIKVQILLLQIYCKLGYLDEFSQLYRVAKERINEKFGIKQKWIGRLLLLSSTNEKIENLLQCCLIKEGGIRENVSLPLFHPVQPSLEEPPLLLFSTEMNKMLSVCFNREFKVEIRNDAKDQLLLKIAGVLKDVKASGCDLNWCRISIQYVHLDSLDISELQSVNESPKRSDVTSIHGQRAQREYKRRAIANWEGSSAQLQGIKRFWYSVSRILDIPTDLRVLNGIDCKDGTVTPPANSADMVGSNAVTLAEFVKCTKTSLSYYTLRNLHHLTSSSKKKEKSAFSYTCSFTDGIIYPLASLESSLSCTTALEYLISLLRLLLKQRGYFKNNVIDYAICLAYLYDFLSTEIQSLAKCKVSVINDATSGRARRIFKSRNYISSDDKCSRIQGKLKFVFEKYGVRLVNIIVEGLAQVTRKGSKNLSKWQKLIGKDPKALLLSCFDACIMHSLLLIHSHPKRCAAAARRASLVYLVGKKVTLTNTTLLGILEEGTSFSESEKQYSSKIGTLRLVLRYLRDCKSLVDSCRDVGNVANLYRVQQHCQNFNFGSFKASHYRFNRNAVDKYIGKVADQLREHLNNAATTTEAMSTASPTNASPDSSTDHATETAEAASATLFVQRLDSINKRILTAMFKEHSVDQPYLKSLQVSYEALRNTVDWNQLSQVYEENKPICNPNDRYSWLLYKDPVLCADLERVFSDAVVTISTAKDVPPWTGDLLMLYGDILSLLNLHAYNQTGLDQSVSSIVEANGDTLDLGQHFGIPLGLFKTLVFSLFFILNRLQGFRRHIKVSVAVTKSKGKEDGDDFDTSYNDDDDDGDEDENENDMDLDLSKTTEFLGIKQKEIPSMYKNMRFTRSLHLSSGVKVAPHPIVSRLLSLLFSLVNAQAQDLTFTTSTNENDNNANYVSLSHMLFTALSQSILLLLLVPFDLRFHTDKTGQDLLCCSPCLIVTSFGVECEGADAPSVLQLESLGSMGNKAYGDVYYVLVDIVESLLQIDSVFLDQGSMPSTSWDIPLAFSKYIKNGDDYSRFACDYLYSHLGLPVFCFNMLSCIFDTQHLTYFDTEVRYLHQCSLMNDSSDNKIGGGASIASLVQIPFLEKLKRVYHARRIIRGYTCYNKIDRLKMPDAEDKILVDLIHHIFMRFYGKREALSNKCPISAVIAAHMHKNTLVLKNLYMQVCNYDSILFINDRLERDYVHAIKDHITSNCLPQVELIDGSRTDVFSGCPDPLVMVSEDHVSVEVLRYYYKYIGSMYKFLQSYDRAPLSPSNCNNILNLISNKPVFNCPPSLRGIYMQIIKQYAMDANRFLEIDPTLQSPREILSQLRIINVASAIVPRNFDVWFACFLRNLELSLHHFKDHCKHFVNFDATKNFSLFRSRGLMYTSQCSRTAALVDLNLRLYFTLLKLNDAKSVKPSTLFFGDVTSSATFNKRVTVRYKILLFSKCILLVQFAKMGLTNVTPNALLTCLSLLLKAPTDVTQDPLQPNMMPIEVQTMAFLADLNVNCDSVLVNSEQWHMLKIRTSVFKRLGKTPNLRPDVQAIIWATTLCGLCDQLAILMKLDGGSAEDEGPQTRTEHRLDNSPYITAVRYMSALNSTFIQRLTAGRNKPDVVEAFYKLHTARLWLVTRHPTLYRIAAPFHFSQNLKFTLNKPDTTKELYHQWVDDINSQCDELHVEKQNVMEDVFAALVVLQDKGISDFACKVAVKLGLYYYRLGNVVMCMRHCRILYSKWSSVRFFCVHNALVDFKKIALLKSMMLFELVSRVVAETLFAARQSDNSVVSDDNSGAEATQVDADVPEDTATAGAGSDDTKQTKVLGKYKYLGLDSIVRLDALFETADSCNQLLHRASRRFKNIATMGYNCTEYTSILYVQNCLYNALIVSLFLLACACPYGISNSNAPGINLGGNDFGRQPAGTRPSARDDKTASKPSDDTVESLGIRIRVHLTKLLLYSVSADLREFLASGQVLETCPKSLGYSAATATMDVRIFKLIYNLNNSKMFQKPQQVANVLADGFLIACNKLLCLVPIHDELEQDGKLTSITLADGNVINVNRDWLLTQKISTPQRANVAYAEALKLYERQTR